MVCMTLLIYFRETSRVYKQVGNGKQRCANMLKSSIVQLYTTMSIILPPFQNCLENLDNFITSLEDTKIHLVYFSSSAKPPHTSVLKRWHLGSDVFYLSHGVDTRSTSVYKDSGLRSLLTNVSTTQRHSYCSEEEST